VVEETTGPRRGNDTCRAADAGSGRRADVTGVLLDRAFERYEITELRHQVAARAAAAGLADDRLQGFVLAVNEVITNAVLHAGGKGQLVLRLESGTAYCAVSDSGPGIPEQLRAVPDVPPTSDVGGRGIWLAHRLCDEVIIQSGDGGTTVGLRIALSQRETPSWLVDRPPLGS
jgi:anti-sigma regulatory factor (Ser/Thr protein kinase)